MDTSKLIGHSVKHVTYGAGKIAFVNDKYIQVIFDQGEAKRFQFPQAFVSFLAVEDASLMSEILMEEQERTSADRRKKEETENRRAQVESEKVSARGALYDKKQKTAEHDNENNVKYKDNVKQGIFEDGIIDLKTSFTTHADVLNRCFGFHYKHYQKAYKNLENGYAVWFPRIARKTGDQYLSSDDYWGWLNILSDSGDTITQMDNPDYPYSGEGCIWRYSTVGFAGLNGRGAFRNGLEAITNGRLPRRLRYAAKALGMRGAHDRLPALANKAAGDRLASLPRNHVLRRLMSRDRGIMQPPVDR